MARPEKTIFISYRRKDISWALLVYKYLTAKGYDVFFDYTSIPSGDFEQIIIGNIKARAHFVLILTPTALDRCDEPGDWLRREIETAISERRNIIPLFFEGFNFGAPSVSEKLLGKLAGIKRYNGLEVPVGYFDEAMEKLRRRYLKVTLDAVLHPISEEVQKVVEEEQSAANLALLRRENIQVLDEPGEELRKAKNEAKFENESQGPRSNVWEKSKGEAITDWFKKTNLRLYGIVTGTLLIAALGIFGINSIINLAPAEGTLPPNTAQTSAIFTRQALPVPSVTSTPTPTRIIPTNTATTIPPTPVPTLGIGSTMVSEKDGMIEVYVPAGEFEMGSNADEGLAVCQKEVRNGCQRDQFTDEEPVHTVYLDAFWIDQTEVTNKKYSICVQDGPCKEIPGDPNYLDPGIADHPVIHVTWDNANTYCSWAGRRLPTEAEWEKAAGWDEEKHIKNIYPWGNIIDCSFANYYYGSKHCIGTTAAVGSYPKGASPYNAFDMSGNVWEWVNDRYQEDYYAILGTFASNPQGPASGNLRTLRGGAWYSFGYDARTAVRYRSDPTVVTGSFGFRCALSASE